VKKVFKNSLVQEALNTFGKWITKDKKSAFGDNQNRTTKIVEDTFHTFTKQMEEPKKIKKKK
jgi:hypothetical protein